jgi:uncharacterized protein YegL
VRRRVYRRNVDPDLLERPGSVLARRPLHFIIVADCSGSMAGDGKIQALNNAVREALPHLVAVADENPHAELLVRAIAFSSGARWHVPRPTPVDQLEWEDLAAGGYTDLGAAIALLREELDGDKIEERALAPALLLVSDGMPTDDYLPELERLMSMPWGSRSVRLAVGIGREFDREVLQRFIGPGSVAPLTATNPEQLVRLIRLASVQASQIASNAVPSTRRYGPVASEQTGQAELTW